MPSPSAPDPLEQARRHFLEGLACYEANRFEAAEHCFLASLELMPGRVSTLVNLAATRLELSKPDEALAAADQVLASEPDSFDGRLHHATALARLGRGEEALAGFDKLLAIDDGHPELWVRHGQVLQSLRRPEDSLRSFDRALAIDGGFAKASSFRGAVLQELNRLDEAAHAYRAAIEHGADAELHAYYLASVGAAEPPATAPKGYVQSLFDDYAGQFDEHLVQVLRYRAHEILVRELPLPEGGAFESALDLGCGTGLCGPLVRPVVRQLTGIDLSARMLARAEALGVYDRLVQADVVEHLRDAGARFDLVLATDVFIYIGDLAPVFDAVRRAMPQAGMFCFCAELDRDESEGFRLQPTLRYAHSGAYLRRLAQSNGFEVVKVLREVIREDRSEAIEGVFFYLSKR